MALAESAGFTVARAGAGAACSCVGCGVGCRGAMLGLTFSVLKGTFAALTSWAGQGFTKFCVKGRARRVFCQ